MGGRKGQRSGGHNKKSSKEHERDGTRDRAAESAVPAGALNGILSSVGTDAQTEMQRLYGIYKTATDAWSSDITDKEARLSATAAIDRFMRIACELAREAPKDESPDQPTDGTPSMDTLRQMRNGNGAAKKAS